MSAKSKQCTVAAAVSEKEKTLFTAMARNELGVSCSALMRRLIRYFQDGKISWTDLFKQYSEISTADEPGRGEKKYMRVNLEPEEYFPFAQHSEGWGSTTGIVLRRLILLYISGKIERGDLWR
jgi:hypothetical protein